MNTAVGIFSHFDYKLIEIPYIEDYADYNPASLIVFKDEDGRECSGVITYINKEIPDDSRLDKKTTLLRKTTPHDEQIIETNAVREADVLFRCKEKVVEHDLDMQLVTAKYSLDGLRLNFIFTAEGRVDFRELVKDLAKIFKKQIHLQQIGPRDKARAISGYGKCGREFCCSGFLRQLKSITMDAVRNQNLASKGSSKLSGVCGKLLCCLNYEMELYQEYKKNLPAYGSKIKTKKGVDGKVIGLDILGQKVKVLLSTKDVEVIELEDIKKVTPPAKKPSEDALPKDLSKELTNS